jgi:acetyl esterase/lipase
VRTRHVVLLVLLAVTAGPSAAAAADARPATLRRSIAERSQTVLTRLARSVCGAFADGPRARPASRRTLPNGARLCDRLVAATSDSGPVTLVRAALAADAPDGTLLQRVRLVANTDAAIDLVTYASSGLVVGGVVCYPSDGRPRSAVIHIHGGTGGIFVNPDGDMLETCWNWAALHGRTAFAPSLRGQDGGEGRLELCLGEADDVVAGAMMLRSLEVTDPARVGLVGGSVGGCVALRAAPRIPQLSAVVSFVAPLSWKDFVQYHSTAFAPATQRTCSGETVEWSVGGTPVAEVIDQVICGRVGCSDADYNARSPLPMAQFQNAPTLIVTAQQDNLVPLEQQVLWSAVRQGAGHPVSISVAGLCDPPAAPPRAEDVLMVVPGAFHTLDIGPISSGLLFLLAELDRPAASAMCGGRPC